MPRLVGDVTPRLGRLALCNKSGDRILSNHSFRLGEVPLEERRSTCALEQASPPHPTAALARVIVR